MGQVGAEHDKLNAKPSVSIICILDVGLCSPTVFVLGPLYLHNSRCIRGT